MAAFLSSFFETRATNLHLDCRRPKTWAGSGYFHPSSRYSRLVALPFQTGFLCVQRKESGAKLSGRLQYHAFQCGIRYFWQKFFSYSFAFVETSWWL